MRGRKGLDLVTVSALLAIASVARAPRRVGGDRTVRVRAALCGWTDLHRPAVRDAGSAGAAPPRPTASRRRAAAARRENVAAPRAAAAAPRSAARRESRSSPQTPAADARRHRAPAPPARLRAAARLRAPARLLLSPAPGLLLLPAARAVRAAAPAPPAPEEARLPGHARARHALVSVVGAKPYDPGARVGTFLGGRINDLFSLNAELTFDFSNVHGVPANTNFSEFLFDFTFSPLVQIPVGPVEVVLGPKAGLFITHSEISDQNFTQR